MRVNKPANHKSVDKSIKSTSNEIKDRSEYSIHSSELIPGIRFTTTGILLHKVNSFPSIFFEIINYTNAEKLLLLLIKGRLLTGDRSIKIHQAKYQ